MGRFSIETEVALRDAGWYPERRVPELVARWKANEMLAEFTMFKAAETILQEFGGLSIDQDGSGETCAREPFVVDPMLAAYEGDRFSDFVPLVNTGLYPLGEAASRHYFWAVGENEHVYLVMNDIQWLGKNIEEALENLIIGRKPKPIV